MNEFKGSSLDYVKRRINNIHSSEPINFCLCWADTREGHEFWRELDSKYCNS